MNISKQNRIRLFLSFAICLLTVGASFAQVNIPSRTLGELKEQNNLTPQNSKNQIVNLEIPEMIYPTNNAANVPIVPLFIIGSVPKADRYEIQLAFDQYFSNLVSSSFWQFDSPLTISQLTWFPSISTISLFRNNTDYYWRIRVLSNNQTETSPWSQPFRYTTRASASTITPPIIVSPLNNSILPWLDVIFQWSRITTATWYQVQWSKNNSMDSFSYQWTTMENPIRKSYLKPASDYYWRIIAFNDNSISQFSTKGNFKTGNQVVLTENDFTFDDGSGYDNYANSLDISWLIKPKNSKQINLSFLSFNTESYYDFVTVYDGSTTSSPVLGKFSGTSLPTSIKSSQGTMLVRFTSDGYSSKAGWSAKYETFVESCDTLDITATVSKISGPWASEYDGSFGSIAVSTSDPNFLIIGSSTLGGGIYKSTDGGATWLSSMNGIDQLGLFTKRCPPISKIIIHPANPNIVYLSTVVDNALIVGGTGSIYRSTNAGADWKKVNGTTNWLGISQIQCAVYDFAVDSFNPDILYAGVTAQGVFKTTNGGIEWEKIVTASVAIGITDYFNVVKTFPTGEIFISGFSYYNEKIIPLPNFKTVGTSGIMPLGLKKSSDGGLTWKNIGTVFTPPALITDLTLESSTNNLFTSTISYQTPVFFPVDNKGIFQSSDLGETWFQSNDFCQESLSEYPLISLFSFSKNQKKNIGIAAGFRGLIISTNGGISWKIVKGIPIDAFITSCTLSEPYNFAATSKGIYSFSLQNATFVKPTELINNHFSLYQNYPNPFNPTTTINYSIPKQSYVTIKIYDALGKEIETLVNENKLMGNYTEEFNATNLSSGIYFYQIKASEFIQTRKMVLVR